MREAKLEALCIMAFESIDRRSLADDAGAE
jgi:hypothetical protein